MKKSALFFKKLNISAKYTAGFTSAGCQVFFPAEKPAWETEKLRDVLGESGFSRKANRMPRWEGEITPFYNHRWGKSCPDQSSQEY